jgi:hypothetical protein
MNVQDYIRAKQRHEQARMAAIRELAASGQIGEVLREERFLEREREEAEARHPRQVVIINNEQAAPAPQSKGSYAAQVVGRALATAGVRVQKKAVQRK